MIDKASIECIKELLRVILLAVIPITIEGLYSGNIDLKLIGIAASIAGLRAVDKLLHEWGKEIETKTKTKSKMVRGLTRF